MGRRPLARGGATAGDLDHAPSLLALDPGPLTGHACAVERAARVYLVAAGLATVVYLAVPWSVVAIGVQYIAHELIAVALILVAIRRYRPERPWLWWSIAGTLATWSVGDAFWYAGAARDHYPFPGPADGFYLVGYLALVGGVTWAVALRQRDRKLGDLLDALLIGVGLGVPTWLLAVGPAWTDRTAGLTGQAVGTAYAVIVLVLIVLFSWALIGGMGETLSGALFLGGFGALILANLGYSVDLLQGLYDPGSGLDVGWLAFFALSGVAALHPSMEQVHRSEPPLEARRSRRRVPLVWAMAAIPPMILIVHTFRGASESDVLLVAAIGTLVGVTLMGARLILLVDQSEQAARSEGEQRLAALVSQIHDVITLHDEHGRLTYVSPAAEWLWGDTGDVLANSLDGLVHPEDRATLRHELQALATMDPGDVARFQVRVWVTPGSWREMDVTAVNQLEHPAIGALVLTFHDVAERVRYERQLQHQADIQTAIAEQLEHVQEMKDTFLTAVSHDLRTPLTSIRGMSELLNRRGDELAGDQRRELQDRIAANAERLERLLLELLDLDRLTRGLKRPERTPVDVDLLAREAVAAQPETRPITLLDGCHTARVDPAMFNSILANLLNNAVKHTPVGTGIWIELTPLDDDGLMVVVEDAGPGIPARKRALVIEAFTRLDESRSTPGHGLGLALVASFARLHGGTIRIEDRRGGGTRIVVVLPGFDGARRPDQRSALAGGSDTASHRRRDTPNGAPPS